MALCQVTSRSFIEYHQGSDPSNPDQLCSQSAMNALVIVTISRYVGTIVLSLTCIFVVFVRINMSRKW
jgi:hypothetical protein